MVGTKDICDWCAEENIMYLNTGDADWPEDWLNIRIQHEYISEIKEKHRGNPRTNRHPIVLQHGNNPGLVSHFVKAGIEYIAKTQLKRDRELKSLIKQSRFAEAAQRLKIREIHVSDIDLQRIRDDFGDSQGEKLMNTWCVDSCIFEIMSEAAAVLGSHDR